MAKMWNLWHGCKKFSAGCANCYVYRSDERYERDASKVVKTQAFDLPVRKNRSGESGFQARPCRYEWILSIQEQCVQAGVTFTFKQTGYNFYKKGKHYTIPRHLQHSQAKKAGINFAGRSKKYI